MAACEKCWREYSRRALTGEYELNYSDVVAEREASGRICTPEEQCGDLHVLVKMTDGEVRCRCGRRKGAA